MSGRTTLLAVAFLVAASRWASVAAWRQWTWRNSSGPGARSGHSLVFYKSELVVFGGRTMDTNKRHVPKTYDIQRVNGTLEFSTYEDKVARPSDDPTVRVGVFLNDVWSYDINCTRYADDSCLDKTWTLRRAGAEWGGCKIVFGARVCSHPSERWFHRAEVFQDDSMLVYGGFSAFCEDFCDDMWLFDFTDNSWTEMMEIGNAAFGPGKRFKFSSVVIGFKMYVFGGFRLWHGFAHENSVENDWSDVSRYPRGGYLNDLWVYDKLANKWTNVTEKVVCPRLTLLQELERIDVECVLSWPPGRAGHASVAVRDAIYIHGGYRTFFPYPSTTGAGAGRGTLSVRGTGFTPYPTHPYYLDDLWKFNLTTGVWSRELVDEGFTPPPRVDHTLVEARGVVFLFGGYISNYYFDDTWQYNVSDIHWRQLKTFVHARYPPRCTDDLENRKLEHSGNYGPFVVPPSVPDDLNGYYFIKERHYGTLKFSVLAEPTRGTKNAPVFVPQARRQAPGWDGCRDRIDGRADLPNELQWEHPSQRAGHMIAYNPQFDQLFIYGGYGYPRESLYQVEQTLDAAPLADLWQYSLKDCAKNCSLHGTCHYGSCRCDDGYYGEDCSNSTCPGSFCFYVDVDHRQVCNHCCFSGFEHTDNDSYVANIQKFPCTHDNAHYSNGVCDGFGKCICRPPFIGDDCSIRDCARNCSGHGYCSVEFPNSRCMCDDGWFGQYCDERLCLNNCSYPNGVCVNGSCFCSMVYEPYNNTREYFPLMGEDCSFLMPFAGALRPTAPVAVVLAVSLAATALSVLA
ncbi:hypothetical protein P43SY_001509 [Pythium insidiosum]|uniref:EGF-like domain-containing protein n=1 Tax=Pythium insidiosum TaxID=114742 RepID=A0AAD5LCB4_PYTIN|nr:hypothetical protein P43SY_001509 [Pythium insidiosum]